MRLRLALVAVAAALAASADAGPDGRWSLAIQSDTESTSATFTTAASFGGAIYYLHNNPTPPVGDTVSQTGLPMNTSAPTATTLYNYDTDRDAFPGRLVSKGASGAGETDATKYQDWRTPVLASPLAVSGTVELDFWSAMKDYGLGKAGQITAHLRDLDPGSGTYVEIASGTLTVGDWQGGSSTWIRKTLPISVAAYVVVPTHRLVLKVVVGSGAADDMWLAYDTAAQSSQIRIP